MNTIRFLIFVFFAQLILSCRSKQQPDKKLKYDNVTENKMNTYNAQNILDALDDDSEYNFFLDLEHGYWHTAGSRINLYADENRWAIVFEKSCFGNRSGYAVLELNYFGNCLINLDPAGLDDMFTCNSKFVPIITGEEFDKIQGDFELVSKEANFVTVRNVKLPIEQDVEKYEEIGIEIQKFSNPQELIDFPSLVRYLHELYPEHLCANERELRTSIPSDIPLLMKIDRWHQKSIYDVAQPSSYETYQLLADVLVSKDVKKWKPTLTANNDWRNWPEAGGL